MGHVAPPLTDLYACIRDELEVVQTIVADELAGEVAEVNELCERLQAYRGKMVRPALLLLCARATGPVNPVHQTLAAVVEMVHMATLVHDDVLDEADERRGHPTIRANGGNVTAVLLGDYLISHAYHLCSSLSDQHAARRVAAATNTVCEGELLQNSKRYDCLLSEADYFDIIRRKTGALTAVSCELGAYGSQASPDTVAAMRDFGLSLGVAFQIVDDVLDVNGDRRSVGKTLGQDFELGKSTLPMIHCLANASPTTASSLREALTGKVPCSADRLREWLEETDSVTYAMGVANQYVQSACAKLDVAQEGDAKDALMALAEFTIHRTY